MATSLAPIRLAPEESPVLEPVRVPLRRTLVPAPELTVTVSDRWDDVEEGLRVIHDGFVEAGYMNPQPSGTRMIAQYLNPATLFIVARMGEEPVGVIALIPDGPFGLPSDRSFREEIDELRLTREPLFEASSMAVRHAWRRHTRQIVAGLLSAAFLAASERPGFRVVMSVEPRQENFYTSLLDTERLGEDRPLYGAPAALLVTDGSRIVRAMLSEGTNGQRMLRDMVLEPDAGWRDDRRAGISWPPERVGELLEEQGCLRSLLGQLRVLGGVLPGLLNAL
jgi:N-acyl amino acid synthase FeeM